MYRSFFQSVTKRAKGSDCYSKAYSFLLRKTILLRFFYWKERKVVSIVTKRGSEKKILIQSGITFSNNFSK